MHEKNLHEPVGVEKLMGDVITHKGWTHDCTVNPIIGGGLVGGGLVGGGLVGGGCVGAWRVG